MSKEVGRKVVFLQALAFGAERVIGPSDFSLVPYVSSVRLDVQQTGK